MNIEEKAKRYDEAIERAKSKIKNDKDHVLYEDDVIEIFPEFKESEDERIRKAISQCVEDMRGPFEKLYGVHHKDVIAWLEKKKEEPSIADIVDEHFWEMLDDEKQGEQKSTDKVEPKFKVGDWVVYTGYLLKYSGKEIYVMQVASVEDDRYNFTDTSTLCFDSEKDMRLWTIEDAKDGDVLVDEDNNIGIYKEIEGICWHSYIYLGCDNRLYGFSIGGSHIQNNTKPATKEQRDLLFQKMKEAGYEWDVEQKQLKKIEQKPAWSEEDEERLSDALFFVREYQIPTKDKRLLNAAKETEDWLKSLKERVQPQPKQWKPSDDRTKTFEKWKPSDDRTKTFEKWIEDNRYQGDARYVWLFWNHCQNN